jgi:hypothetical protein
MQNDVLRGTSLMVQPVPPANHTRSRSISDTVQIGRSKIDDASAASSSSTRDLSESYQIPTRRHRR